MSATPIRVESSRVILRPWTSDDLPAWVAMNADPEVMEFFEHPLTADESLQMAERIMTRMDEQGWGLWALEIKGGAKFAGFVGLSQQDLGLPFTPCIEIGWRLARDCWGQGYASEAATLALEFGQSRFKTIYSFTAAGNVRSRKVMERIGLVERPELAFDHPRVTRQELKAHVVYSTT